MELQTIEKTTDNDVVRICASVSVEDGGGPQQLWYEFPAEYAETVELNGSALLPALLFPAMKSGRGLKLNQPIDRQLLANVERLMDIFHCWYPQLQKVEISAPEMVGSRVSTPDRTALFFSGGVDSFYSLIKNEPEIDSLLVVHGFDIPLGQSQRFRRMLRRIQLVGEQFSKRVIPVRTNVKEFTDAYVGFGSIAHGALLSSVALLLDGHLNRAIVPSSNCYDDLFRWGSHPLTDPLWSSTTLSIVHDGSEVRRIDKVLAIADSPAVQRNLRVCAIDDEHVYNCGHCEKCIRTMVSLRIAGTLELVETFQEPLDLSAVRRLQINGKGVMAHLTENIATLKKMGTDPELLTALEDCYRRYDPHSIRFLLKQILHQIDQRYLKRRIKRAFGKS
ncbi:hypothetical protein [Motiliproteus sp.]|uniref:hypothetical protein n=1 Tax=Motiliproteus sp. TaxID=1898955 RepID=UPI003BAADD4A